MKAKGYMGRILTVDLTTGTITESELDDSVARKFIGGSGLGAKILLDEKIMHCDPLGPENILIFAVGPLTGSSLFNSDRFDVVTKSPLTGIYAESSAGGYWAGKFKKCGYDALIIKGKAASPVYLAVSDGKAEIKDARPYWGKDTFTVTEMLQHIEGPGTKAAVIGPAGEKLVKMAGIVSDGKHGRLAARCGVGAVMGSKNLKAVTVNGTTQVELADKAAIMAINKDMSGLIKQNMQGMAETGTGGGLDASEELGNLPVKNWAGPAWKESAAKITGLTMAQTHLVKNYNCGSCAIKCGRVVRSVSGPFKGQEIGGPEYETLGLLGSNLLVDDLDTIITANEMCNQYGIDTISVGGVIGFAMEAFERGILSAEDNGGNPILWGDAETIYRLIKDISEKEGLGAVLSEGVRSAAAVLGPRAEEFAAHVKGLEPPAHDGRAKFTAGIGMATSNRGACHLSGFAHDFEEGAVLEDLGSPALPFRFTPEGKAENVFRMQNLMGMFDSVNACKFALFGGLTVDPLIRAVNAATGWDMDRKEFFETGERIFNIKRIFDNHLGIGRKDDVLPQRMMRSRRGRGTVQLPPLFEMLDEYYGYRGWDELGVPTSETLERLGLTEYSFPGSSGAS